MSIVRVGLSEAKQFSEGYEAIFGGRKKAARPAAPAASKKPARKPASKKPARKK